jgi:hypothetical protein
MPYSAHEAIAMQHMNEYGLEQDHCDGVKDNVNISV